MSDVVANFAKGTVSTGYDASATSIVLSSGDGANFPSSFSYNVVWWNSTDYPDPADDPNVEIVRVSARSTDTLTVTRAQESTSATTKNTAGKTYKMILAVTAKIITDINNDSAQVFNESGADVDFRIESDINTHAFFLQGSDSAIGLGTATPQDLLHIFGDQGSGLLRVQGDSVTSGHYTGLEFVMSTDETTIPKSAVYFERTGGSGVGTLHLAVDGVVDANPVVLGDAKLSIDTNGYIGIGITTGMAGQVHIDQSSTSGAIPVLVLDQADVDEDYLKIIGTSDTNVDRALVDAVNFSTPGSIVGWLKINVQDDQATDPIVDGDYYIPFYAAPSA